MWKYPKIAGLFKIASLLVAVLISQGAAGGELPCNSTILDSIPAPGERYHSSICWDSSGFIRVLHNVPYKVWTDTLIFKIEPTSGKVLDSISLHLDCMGPWEMAFAFDKFWLTGGAGDPSRVYVYKVDERGKVLDRIPTPVVSPASGNGIAFENNRLWITSADPIEGSGLYQLDTLGRQLRFVRVDNVRIGIPAFLAYHSKAPATLIISTWQNQLCQITTTAGHAKLLRTWTSPFSPPEQQLTGSTFDKQGLFWANNTDKKWFLKLDLRGWIQGRKYH